MVPAEELPAPASLLPDEEIDAADAEVAAIAGARPFAGALEDADAPNLAPPAWEERPVAEVAQADGTPSVIADATSLRGASEEGMAVVRAALDAALEEKAAAGSKASSKQLPSSVEQQVLADVLDDVFDEIYCRDNASSVVDRSQDSLADVAAICGSVMFDLLGDVYVDSLDVPSPGFRGPAPNDGAERISRSSLGSSLGTDGTARRGSCVGASVENLLAAGYRKVQMQPTEDTVTRSASKQLPSGPKKSVRLAPGTTVALAVSPEKHAPPLSMHQRRTVTSTALTRTASRDQPPETGEVFSELLASVFAEATEKHVARVDAPAELGEAAAVESAVWAYTPELVRKSWEAALVARATEALVGELVRKLSKDVDRGEVTERKKSKEYITVDDTTQDYTSVLVGARSSATSTPRPPPP